MNKVSELHNNNNNRGDIMTNLQTLRQNVDALTDAEKAIIKSIISMTAVLVSVAANAKNQTTDK